MIFPSKRPSTREFAETHYQELIPICIRLLDSYFQVMEVEQTSVKSYLAHLDSPHQDFRKVPFDAITATAEHMLNCYYKTSIDSTTEEE